MKKLVLFLLVMGCILQVTAAHPWSGYGYGSRYSYPYERYSRFPSFWGYQPYVQPYYPNPTPSYYAQPNYQDPYTPYRPFPVLATGRVVQPDPGDRFPWQYYPDYYAQQYYDLDRGEVILKGNAALPSTVRVKVGDTVTWKSKDGYPHVIKSAQGPESFDSGSLIFGESFSKQFNQEGSYEYYDPLSWLRGRVVVSAT